jgi:endonuclease/exonuclease/phosphatase family metal-dependent hydrolase
MIYHCFWADENRRGVFDWTVPSRGKNRPRRLAAWILAAVAAPVLLFPDGGRAAEAPAAPSTASPPIRVMTFNIRYGTADDGENSWPLRKALLREVIQTCDPDLLGMQEALRDQLDELSRELGTYASVGVGREADGTGEYSPLFYRRDRFDVAESSTFWLSTSPQTPGSMTWGNTLPRICTWARLLDRTTGRRFYVFNTHWDHQSQKARAEAGRLISQVIAGRGAPDEPAVVMGDFNADPANPAIGLLTRDGRLLSDTYTIIRPAAVGQGTFHAFRGDAGERKIDGVLVTQGWETIDADIVRTSREGRYPSDHYPVTAVIRPINQR